MKNNMSQSAQNAKSNQAGQANANALTATTTGAMNSKIEQSMRDYGTYTATSDANNEYPPKNQMSGNMNMMQQGSQSASSAPQNSQNANMTNSAAPQNKQNANMTGSASNAGQSAQTNGTLTAQYDANGNP